MMRFLLPAARFPIASFSFSSSEDEDDFVLSGDDPAPAVLSSAAFFSGPAAASAFFSFSGEMALMLAAGMSGIARDSLKEIERDGGLDAVGHAVEVK